MSHRPIGTLAALAVVPLLAACDRGAPPTCSDGGMVEAIEAFVQAGPEGARTPLDDITDFEWDQVHAFSGLAYSDEVERVVGLEFEHNSDTDSLLENAKLLVFVLEDEITCQAMVWVPLFPVTQETPQELVADEAVLTILSEDPGPYHAFELGRR